MGFWLSASRRRATYFIISFFLRLTRSREMGTSRGQRTKLIYDALKSRDFNRFWRRRVPIPSMGKTSSLVKSDGRVEECVRDGRHIGLRAASMAERAGGACCGTFVGGWRFAAGSHVGLFAHGAGACPGHRPGPPGRDMPLEAYGFDSVMAVELTETLRRPLERCPRRFLRAPDACLGGRHFLRN